MDHLLLVNSLKEKKMEKVYLNGTINHIMKEIFKMKIFMVMVNTIGLMEEFTKDNGLMVEWKDKEFIYMKEKNIQVSIYI